MAQTWWSIRVELVEGGGLDTIWPRPGRVFAAARAHSFAQLHTAIDDAFARWDRSHLHEFELADGTRIGPAHDDDPQLLDSGAVTLNRLRAGQQFVYVFDLGDQWTHLCTVGPARIDPLETLGVHPNSPLPYWGWGTIPDQYGRDHEHGRYDDADNNADGDADGDGPDSVALPPDHRLSDLPALRPWWGPGAAQ